MHTKKSGSNVKRFEKHVEDKLVDEEDEEKNEWAWGSQRLQQSAAQHSIYLPLLFPGGKPLAKETMLEAKRWRREREQWWWWTQHIPYSLSLILSFRASWSVLTRRPAEADAGLTGLSTPSRCLRTYPHPPSEVTQGFEGTGIVCGRGQGVGICGGLERLGARERRLGVERKGEGLMISESSLI